MLEHSLCGPKSKSVKWKDMKVASSLPRAQSHCLSTEYLACLVDAADETLAAKSDFI